MIEDESQILDRTRSLNKRFGDGTIFANPKPLLCSLRHLPCKKILPSVISILGNNGLHTMLDIMVA